MPCFVDTCNVVLVHGIGYCPSLSHVVLRCCKAHYDQLSVVPQTCDVPQCGLALLWKADGYLGVISAHNKSYLQALSAERRYPPNVVVQQPVVLPPQQGPIAQVGPSFHQYVQLAPAPYVPPVLEHAERKKLEAARIEEIKKIRAETDEAWPIKINGVAPCPHAPPTTLVVALRSETPEVTDVESGTVRFEINGGSTTRTGRTVGIQLKMEQAQTVKVTADDLAPWREFATLTKEATVDLNPGDKKEIELVFKPNASRRFYARFLFLDAAQKPRPFPAGMQFELYVEWQEEDDKEKKMVSRDATLIGELKPDGSCFDPRDGKPGVRLSDPYESIKPRFPAHAVRRRFVWTTAAPDPAPTELLDEGQPVPDTKTACHLLPTYAFIPTSRHWTVPDLHKAQGKVRHTIDATQLESVGSPDAPLVYVLRETHGALINGKRIDHVVLLMMENRGFDHVMGYLYDHANAPPKSLPAQGAGKHAALRVFEGLDGLAPGPLVNQYDYTDATKQRHQGQYSPTVGARACNVPRTNPHECFVNIFQDMYGFLNLSYPEVAAAMSKRDTRNALVKTGPNYNVPPMNGWVQNFANAIEHHRGLDALAEALAEKKAKGAKIPRAEQEAVDRIPEIVDANLSEILDMYLPEQLPVMSGLARSYAISDLWFCSVPSQTNTNRAFWTAGTAVGLVTNNHYDAYKDSHNPAMQIFRKAAHGSHADALPPKTRSLFDVLEEDGVPWKYYWSVSWPPSLVGGGQYFRTMCSQFQASAFNANFPSIDQFVADAKAGKLAPVTYLEPTWGGGTHWEAPKRGVGNEFHPVEDMHNGEFFIKKLYEALTSNPAWDRTLFLITFDENGGTYDHFPPWKAKPTGREPDGEALQFGFEFDCYGVRVPTIVISRYVEPGTLFRSPTAVPYDHTSIIASVLHWQGVDPATAELGERVKDAPLIDHVLTGSGDGEPARRKKALGLAQFAGDRGAAVTYDDTFYLKYIGTRWPAPTNSARPYLGGPITEGARNVPFLGKVGGTFRAVGTKKDQALKFRFVRASGAGEVKTGTDVQLVVAEGEAAGYSICIPSVGFNLDGSKVMLTSLEKPFVASLWVVWPFADRCDDAPFHYGEEVVIFSYHYLWENVKSMTDPYKKLCLQAGDVDVLYSMLRPGEWDLWVLEKA